MMTNDLFARREDGGGAHGQYMLKHVLFFAEFEELNKNFIVTLGGRYCKIIHLTYKSQLSCNSVFELVVFEHTH